MFIVERLIAVCFVWSVASCGSASPVSADDRFVVEKVFDVGNTYTATDIRIHLVFKNGIVLSEVADVRLMVVPDRKSITADEAKNLPSQNFFSIPLSTISNQVVKLPKTLKDTQGSMIDNGKYYACIAILGKDNSVSLSERKEFVLSDKPVYAGDYIGSWEDLGPPGPAKFPMSLRIADDYSGTMFYANATFKPFGSGTQDATTTMVIDGTTISSFNLNQLIDGYNNGCMANKTLTGNFEDDLNLVLNTFEWSDCDGTRQVKLKFTRQ